MLSVAALAQLEDRERLRVVPLDRINFNPVVLVTYSSEPLSPSAKP